MWAQGIEHLNALNKRKERGSIFAKLGKWSLLWRLHLHFSVLKTTPEKKMEKHKDR